MGDKRVHLTEQDADPVITPEKTHDLPLSPKPARAVPDVIGTMLAIKQSGLIVVDDATEGADHQIHPPVVKTHTSRHARLL